VRHPAMIATRLPFLPTLMLQKLLASTVIAPSELRTERPLVGPTVVGASLSPAGEDAGHRRWPASNELEDLAG
jgi:hypothetical protein